MRQPNSYYTDCCNIDDFWSQEQLEENREWWGYTTNNKNTKQELKDEKT